MSGICYRKHRERGPWFEIECMRESIKIGEALGKDKSFERELLKSWSEYPGYESAAEPFR